MIIVSMSVCTFTSLLDFRYCLSSLWMMFSVVNGCLFGEEERGEEGEERGEEGEGGAIL